MPTAGGPGPDVDLAAAKARYRAGDTDVIVKEYRKDASQQFLFWLIISTFLAGFLSYVDLMFVWAFVPLALMLLFVTIRAVLKNRRRSRSINLDMRRQQQKMQSEET